MIWSTTVKVADVSSPPMATLLSSEENFGALQTRSVAAGLAVATTRSVSPVPSGPAWTSTSLMVAGSGTSRPSWMTSVAVTGPPFG